MRLVKESTKKILGFDDTWFMLIGMVGIALILPLLFFNEQALQKGLAGYLAMFGISLIHTIAYWVSMRTLIIRLRVRYPAYEDNRKRILNTLALAIVIYLVLNFLLDYVVKGCLQPLGMDDPPEVAMNFISILLILAVSALYESIFVYYRWKESIIEREKLERMHFQSQLEGLRSQVNPHFLFNSLNTLCYIIPEDPDKAVNFVQRLSKVYRYILEIRDKKLISLEEELKFLQSYLFLLKERFGENLQVEIDIPPYLQSGQIVPLSLQLLFENAIKHNIISSAHPLLVEVFTENDDALVIRNNLQRKHQEQPSTKVGLENIRDRFAFFSDRLVQIEETGDYFTVRLPLVKAGEQIAEQMQ